MVLSRGYGLQSVRTSHAASTLQEDVCHVALYALFATDKFFQLRHFTLMANSRMHRVLNAFELGMERQKPCTAFGAWTKASTTLQSRAHGSSAHLSDWTALRRAWMQ
jgi:hypothetical protein